MSSVLCPSCGKDNHAFAPKTNNWDKSKVDVCWNCGFDLPSVPEYGRRDNEPARERRAGLVGRRKDDALSIVEAGHTIDLVFKISHDGFLKVYCRSCRKRFVKISVMQIVGVSSVDPTKVEKFKPIHITHTCEVTT